MPRNTTIDIPHVSVTDHYIRKPMPAKEADKIREFIGLACINNQEVDMVTKGKAYLSYYEKFDHKRAWLDSAEKYLPGHTDDDVQKNLRSLVRWAFLKEDYQSVLLFAEKAYRKASLVKSYSNEDAWMAYRIGESWSRTGDKLKAEAFFKDAVELAPYIPEFREKLGAAQVENGNVAAARENFEFLVRENPEFVSGYIDLGFIALSSYRDAARADSLYSRALALDPDNEQALINKAGTQVYLNKPEEARKLLMRVLSVNPSNDRAKQLLRAL
jgi:tetratricopeptide (TPR) repeat protein